ncbi:GroES-like protein [Ceratobasidium sp. AG-I]|nr:GroES-like protein [Ceratobasidium sp. AG-I]
MSEISVPQTMKAVIVQEGKTTKVENIPVPALEKNEVLIKVNSIALNPGDWKHVDVISPPGNILGCDLSGIVVKLGSDSVTRLKVGDTVSAFVHGGNYPDRGAFAEYVQADSELVWKFSTDALSFEQAATMNCTFWTAIQAMYLGMHLREPSSHSKEEEWLLIYGGSTSVGLFAIQLAKASGYKVVTAVSPKNFELVKSLGANAVVNYKSPDVVEDIQKATGNSLRLALDTVSEAATQAICVKSISPTPKDGAPGNVGLVLYPDDTAKSLRKDVTVQNTVIYTVHGRTFSWGSWWGVGPITEFAPSSVDHDQMALWMPKIEALVNSGTVKPNPVKFWPGGLEAVSEGLQYLREGKVSGEKIVYKV